MSDQGGEAGAGGANAGTAGTPSGGASSAGSGGSVQAGAGGASAGAANAGAGGAGTAGSVGLAGAGGAVGNGCASTAAQGFCSPYTATVPKACVPAEGLKVGFGLPSETCHEICGSQFFSCNVSSFDASSVTLLCNPGCAIGRRPAGLSEPRAVSADALGDYFAQIAHLEAASVTAFRVLRDELRAKGAPKKLVRAAARAARDEVRHARSTRALARRFGGTPPPVDVSRGPERSLEAMALENAVEGCVRETYGALLATRQAEQARDPGVRAAMQGIARDETRHAALSWSVGRWLETRLEPAAKQAVARAKQAAARELREALAKETAPAFAALIGLPSPEEAARMAVEMQRTLWS